jgi:hypothetical protein
LGLAASGLLPPGPDGGLAAAPPAPPHFRSGCNHSLTVRAPCWRP